MNKDNLKLIRTAESKSNIIPSKNEILKAEIVKSISTGESTVPEDLVNNFNISYDQAISILSDPQFLSNLKNYSRAKMSMHFHSKGIAKLQEAVECEDIKTAIQAIKLQAQLSDNLKSAGTDVNINLNLEQMVKATEKVVSPLANVNAEPIIDLEKVS